jgi:formylglycine-generating enzyme required for sulfatase activity
MLQEESGIVFVLLPGGCSQVGAVAPSAENPAGSPGIDPWGRDEESPVDVVHLDPFFVSKYEVTVGQWDRLAGDVLIDPTITRWVDEGRDEGFELLPAWLPKFQQSRLVVEHHFLALPTEAQWEYSARGGTTTAWCTGDDKDDIARQANVLDGGGGGGAHIGPFPANTCFANAFGLHHVHGNLSEWTGDGLGDYVVPVEDGKGNRYMRGGSNSVRGGNYQLPSEDARSARRMGRGDAEELIGLRPVRAIAP